MTVTRVVRAGYSKSTRSLFDCHVSRYLHLFDDEGLSSVKARNRRHGLNWILAEKIIASDPGLFAYFGCAVSLDSTNPLAIVGARSKDGLHADEGRAYVLRDFPVTLPGTAVDPNRFVLVASILWGLVAGGRGVIWQPGTGPVPVDPEPFRQWSSSLSPSKRDLLAGLALSEIADLLDDRSSQRAIHAAALNLMEAAVSQMRDGKIR